MTPNQFAARQLTLIGYFLSVVGWAALIGVVAHDASVSWPAPVAVLVIGLGSACFVLGYRKRRAEQVRRACGACGACGYALTTGMHTCPECGQQRRV